MKVGDLVRFRKCKQEGKFGMITLIPKPSHLAQSMPHLRLYWVLCDTSVKCFTGNQLVLV